MTGVTLRDASPDDLEGIVAVFLGWLILSESVTWAILVGGAIVVGAVAVVVSAERQTNRNAAAAREAVATR